MLYLTPATLDALLLSVLFAASGGVHVYGPRFLQRAYRQWGFPPRFHRSAGALHLLIAVFLAIPLTRIWGAALASLVMFAAVVTLLNHRQYAYSLPGMLVMAALVPAFLSGPF